MTSQMSVFFFLPSSPSLLYHVLSLYEEYETLYSFLKTSTQVAKEKKNKMALCL